MKNFIQIRWLVALSFALIVELPAQQAAEDERSRLMQEYMARRAEWVEVRKHALDRVKAAQTEAEKKELRAKLEQDEKPLLDKMTEAGRAYAAAEKAHREKRGAEGKPTK
jgi:hypothetical protein